MKLFVSVLSFFCLSFLTTVSTDVSDTLDIVCQPSDVNGHVYFVVHPNDCQKFFMCQGYVGILMHCPGNLQFVTSLNVCNYESKVQCDSTSPPINDLTNSESQEEVKVRTTSPEAASLIRKITEDETTTESILATKYTEKENTTMKVETTTLDLDEETTVHLKTITTEDATSSIEQLKEKFYFLLNRWI